MQPKNIVTGLSLLIIFVVGISVFYSYSKKSSKNLESDEKVSSAQMNSYKSPNGYSLEVPVNYIVTENDNQYNSHYPPVLKVKGKFGYLIISPGYVGGKGLEGWVSNENELVTKSGHKLSLVEFRPSEDVKTNKDKITASVKTITPWPIQFTKDAQILIETNSEDEFSVFKSVLESLFFERDFVSQYKMNLQRDITLYYYDGNNYQTRSMQIAKTNKEDMADTTLKLLFATFLTDLSSYYIKVSFLNGVITVDFGQGARHYLDQGVAGVSAKYTNSIRKTLLQLEELEIEKVNFSIDGKVITDWDA